MRFLLIPSGIALAAGLVLFLTRSFVLRLLQREAKRRPSLVLNETLLGLFRGPSFAICIGLALYFGIYASDLPFRYSRQVYRAIYVMLMISVTMAAANIVSALFKEVVESSGKVTRTAGLSVIVVKGTILALGGLIILSFLGISIAPLLGALGVGGLAIALSLKETMENIFAGLYLITDKTIRVGDYVMLESGQEGTVEDIGWRTTRVTTSRHNAVIIPNSKLSQSVVANYSFPDPRVCSSVRIAVTPDSDVDKVEALLLEVARQGSEDIAGLLSTPDPTARLTPTLSAYGAFEYVLNFYVKSYSDQGFVGHELKKRAYRRLKQDGVKFPSSSGAEEARKAEST